MNAKMAAGSRQQAAGSRQHAAGSRQQMLASGRGPQAAKLVDQSAQWLERLTPGPPISTSTGLRRDLSRLLKAVRELGRGMLCTDSLFMERHGRN